MTKHGPLAVAFAALLTAGFGQAPQFRSGTDIVAMSVTVSDAEGRAVRGLPVDVFAVYEDDRPRSIVQFTNDPVPLSLAFAIDTSFSMRGPRFERAREAVGRLLERFGPDDEVFVIGFSGRPFTIAKWTSGRERVAQALEGILPDGNTALFDGVSEAIAAMSSARNRHQAVVVISDGNDRQAGDQPVGMAGDGLPPARLRLLHTVARLSRSEALVYAIGIDAPNTGGHDPLDAAALRQLTDPSGAFTQVVRSEADVIAAAERIGEELRHQYMIGFTPARQVDGKFHRVRIAVKDCPCRVRARAGYVAERSPAR